MTNYVFIVTTGNNQNSLKTQILKTEAETTTQARINILRENPLENVQKMECIKKVPINEPKKYKDNCFHWD